MPLAETGGGWSLRNRLLALLAVLLAVLMAAGTAIMYLQAEQASQRLYDESLRQSGELLLQLAAHEVEEHGPKLGETLFKLETQPGPFHLRYQIWTDDRRAYRTTGAPDTPWLPLGHAGFGWAQVEGETWRAYALQSAGGHMQLQIAESLQYRESLPKAIFGRMVASMLLLLALGVPLIGWILSQSFSGVQRVARSVAARNASDLQPVDAAPLPREVAPLIGGLNRMLGKVRAQVENERRFTADAAHELRTPLASIRLNAQLIQAAPSPEAFHDAAGDLLAGVDRSSRLIEQLLALARLDSGQERMRQFEDFELAHLLAAQLPEQERLAGRRDVEIELQAAPARVHGDRELLAVLLRNLVDNAIRYGGAGAHVTIASRACNGQAELSVSDTGPGIAPSERARIFERFYRIEGTTEYGSGLGLSIVRRIADLHGAQVELRDGPGGRGTEFVVHFPPPAGVAAAG
jgi:two-component system OmpR family sensor kinase/two-component system sensor histidine kinase QseC